MEKIYFFKDYLLEHYGRQMHRIPIDLPLSCPNREKNSGAGCIYCADDGNRARHLRHNLSLPDQVARGIEYVRTRYCGGPPYIAYFQSFTNTNAPVEILRNYYSEVLRLADFRMMIVSTRPDCLGGEILDLLCEFKQQCDVWVELGVQTSNEKTLRLIRRGHSFEDVKTAAARLAERGIKSAAHVIIGLPGEGPEDFRQTARDIAALPFAGVKLHNLLVLKNTPLAKMYADPAFQPQIKIMNEYEYAAAAADFLRLLPSGWTVMRVTADADEKDVIAPKWWMKKGQFIDYLCKYMEQGGNLLGEIPGTETGDGSLTLYHPEYRQHFHTLAGAVSEARHKFIIPSKLHARLIARQEVKVLDIGFGLGYNVFEAVKTAHDAAAGRLSVISLEKDIRTLQAASRLFGADSLELRILDALSATGSFRSEFAEVTLMTGDARHSVKLLKHGFDCIYLDGFSPDINPELWTLDFFRELKRLLEPSGIIVTYSSAYPVRGAMLKCGLQAGETDAFGRRRGGTAAAADASIIESLVAEKDMNIILKSTAGTPYRDPGLDNAASWILEHHKRAIARLRSLGIPKWFK
ncbi:MAG: TIGR01212 family radical SAM protein [Victivallaceae bacterium]|jgi:radical SAM protein (TIGR01212 family)